MKIPSRLDYAFAVGRVKALERQLVSQAVFREAAEERDLFSVLKIIFDAGTFFSESLEVHNSEELDDFLAAEEKIFLESMMELFLDKAIFQVVLDRKNPERDATAARIGEYDFIVDYFRHAVDLGNLKIFARAKYLSLPESKFRAAVLKGGFLDIDILLKNYDLPMTEVGEMLYVTPYQHVWNQAVDTLEENETFIDLEEGFETFLMRYLRKAKYIVFGPEPVFAYTMAKLRELDLIRLLGVGKLNQVPFDILKKRVSETYV